MYKGNRTSASGDLDPRRWRWRGELYLTLHCHHQNDFCITMGACVVHVNVSLALGGNGGRVKFRSLDRLYLTRSSLRRGSGGPRDPRRWAEGETMP